MTQAEPSLPAPTPRRYSWRRLFQYRLRTLLALTAIIAVALGWWSYKARQQRAAVAAFGKLGGNCHYDFRLPWTPGMKNPPNWPQWLLNRASVDYFATVDFVRFESKAADVDLGHLENLTALKKVVLSNTQITDAGLQHLNGLAALQYLYLDNTQITDAGLKNLKNLTALRELGLKGTRLTDTGLEQLKSLPTLQQLDLEKTNVTDKGLEHLGKLPALDVLNLHGTQVTDAGVARLQQIKPNCLIVYDRSLP
ncbi:MAG: leucine-rich repeat domain-containing protein [Planctomycetia bacterium]|nr:leucine-rich repeat domain-containing protein [Planctomycetia bacterium]